MRCIFFDTPAHEAQINVVARMLRRFGSVLAPAERVDQRRLQERARDRLVERALPHHVQNVPDALTRAGVARDREHEPRRMRERLTRIA